MKLRELILCHWKGFGRNCDCWTRHAALRMTQWEETTPKIIIFDFSFGAKLGSHDVQRCALQHALNAARHMNLCMGTGKISKNKISSEIPENWLPVATKPLVSWTDSRPHAFHTHIKKSYLIAQNFLCLILYLLFQHSLGELRSLNQDCWKNMKASEVVPRSLLFNNKSRLFLLPYVKVTHYKPCPVGGFSHGNEGLWFWRIPTRF